MTARVRDYSRSKIFHLSADICKFYSTISALEVLAEDWIIQRIMWQVHRAVLVVFTGQVDVIWSEQARDG